MQGYTRKTCTGTTKKQFLRTPMQLSVQLAYSGPRPPHPPNPDAVLQLFRKLEQEEATRMEDMSGTHWLVSAFLRSSWPGRHRRIATSQELQLELILPWSGPGLDSIITPTRSGWLSLQTEVLTARVEIAGTAIRAQNMLERRLDQDREAGRSS